MDEADKCIITRLREKWLFNLRFEKDYEDFLEDILLRIYNDLPNHLKQKYFGL